MGRCAVLWEECSSSAVSKRGHTWREHCLLAGLCSRQEDLPALLDKPTKLCIFFEKTFGSLSLEGYTTCVLSSVKCSHDRD